MKILLVEPPISPFDVPTGAIALPPPHHLERLAGAIIDNHEVRIFDMRIEENIEQELSEFCPDMVGISCVAANYNLSRGVLLKRVKQYNAEIITLIGGHHPSLAPQMCNDKSIDIIVIGEGELTLKELADAYSLNKTTDIKNINGIAYREKGEFKINPPRELMDINSLPNAARHLTAKYRKKNLYFRASWRPTDCVISSRGCPYRCKFCGLWKINHGHYRYRKPELIADEIETITEPYINFIDDNTLDNVPNAFRLAEVIKERGIKKTYEIYGRPDTVVRYPELVEKLRGVGVKLILLGIEACDQEVLTSMNKKLSVETNKKAIEICHANDIEIAAYLLVDPRFNKDDFHRLSDFVAKNKLTHPIFTVLTPFPGTDLYEEVHDKLITKSLDIMDFYHTVLPTTLGLDEFYAEFIGLYQKAYSLKNFIKSIFKNKAVLSPGGIGALLNTKRRMVKLRSHHYLLKD
mgnify:CR=1 FL=1